MIGEKCRVAKQLSNRNVVKFYVNAENSMQVDRFGTPRSSIRVVNIAITAFLLRAVLKLEGYDMLPTF